MVQIIDRRGALAAETLDAAGLRAIDPGQWDRLAIEALVENPFYSRQFVIAGLDTVDAGRDLRAFAVRDAGGRLVGLFPFSGRTRSRYPLPAAFGSANEFQFSSAPLVHRDRAEEAIGLWLDGMRHGRGRKPWALRNVDTSSPLVRMMVAAAEVRGMHVARVLPYPRAILTRAHGGLDAHVAAVLSKNRLKDVRRTLRRLDELGTIEVERATAPDHLARRLEDFLRLEHAGWKREAGTSMLARQPTAEFARRAFANSAGSPAFCRIDSLLLDGRPIAMKLSIRSGRIAFTPKIAYDETYRKLGPGMALEFRLLEAFFSDREIDAVDAAATADAHSSLNFFDAQAEMATLIVGADALPVKLLAASYVGRERLKALLARHRRGSAEPRSAAGAIAAQQGSALAPDCHVAAGH